MTWARFPFTVLLHAYGFYTLKKEDFHLKTMAPLPKLVKKSQMFQDDWFNSFFSELFTRKSAQTTSAM